MQISNNIFKNTSQKVPKGLILSNNSNDYVKYTLFDQEAESIKKNENKCYVDKKTINSDDYIRNFEFN